MTASFPAYWGDVHSAVSGCESTHFNHEDTITQSYDSPHLRERTCQQLCGGPGCVITDAVIFTHSMANLYLASALAHGDCHLGASTSWFLSNPPALGSHAAKIATDLCESGLFRCPLVVPGSCSIARQVFMEMGLCSGPDRNHLEPTPMIRSLDPAYRGLNGSLDSDAMLSVMEKHASGGMCGTKPHGLKCSTAQQNSTHSCAIDGVGLWAIGALSFPLKRSDGMVPLDSCELRQQSYVPDWHSKWYLLAGNHEDGTCRNGDASTGTAQQPCMWYGERVAESIHASAGARYSCPSASPAASQGCVRNDTGGAFASESHCLLHCSACADTKGPLPLPCQHGGRCVPPQSWADAERGFDCECAIGFAGVLCEDEMPKALPAAAAAGSSLGRTLLILLPFGLGALLLVGGIMGVIKCRRSQEGHSSAASTGVASGGGGLGDSAGASLLQPLGVGGSE
jgi:hypothetical protein